MFFLKIRKSAVLIIIVSIIFMNLLGPFSQVEGADHLEATIVSADPFGDLGDTFAFLDPNDNSKVILAMSVAGFIPPAEQLNIGYFPEDILYRFEIENTGDAVSDLNVDVTFSAQTSRTQPQLATVTLPVKRGQAFYKFGAPTTLPTFSPTANPFVVTTSGRYDARFYAGLTDDPFYFDIVGFGRFVGSVLGGNPDPTRLQRSRDSFAGYNCHMIVVSVPAELLRGPSGDVIGVNGVTLRQQTAVRQSNGMISRSGPFRVVDRTAVPAVNTALIPFPRKNEYNAATTQDDANGVFAGSIVGTLTALGTNMANIGILASVAVSNGDILRLNLTTPNNSVGFGERITTPGYVGFPNGRRPGDDTIDTLLFFITNQAIVMGDNVNSNELPIPNSFPYFAPPHQPFENPTLDDRTRN